MTSSYFFAFMPGAEVKRAKMLMSFSPDPEPRAPYPPADARTSPRLLRRHGAIPSGLRQPHVERKSEVPVSEDATGGDPPLVFVVRPTQPPPPGVNMRSTSPDRIVIVHLSASRSARD